MRPDVIDVLEVVRTWGHRTYEYYERITLSFLKSCTKDHIINNGESLGKVTKRISVV